MANYSTNQFKAGLKVLVDNNPCSIVEIEVVKPGKGQAFTRVKFKDLINNRVLEKTFKSGESVAAADVLELDLQYLYNDGDSLNFMDLNSFEQYIIDIDKVGDNIKWLVEQDICTVILFNNNPIQVIPPNHVVLEVVDTEPGLKGDTQGTGGKPATMNTGAIIRVPLFINVGDKVKIDTRSAEYISRA